MLQSKSKILGEDKYNETIFGSLGDITISVHGYDNFDYNPYIRVYKHKDHCILQRMCRLSLLEPKYIGLNDETLTLSNTDIETVISILNSSAFNIFAFLVSIIYDQYSGEFEEIDNILKQNIKISNSNFKDFSIPNYLLLENNKSILYNEKSLIEFQNNFYNNLSINKDSTMMKIYNVDDYKSIFVNFNLEYPSIIYIDKNGYGDDNLKYEILMSLMDYKVLLSSYNYYKYEKSAIQDILFCLSKKSNVIDSGYFDTYELSVLIFSKYNNIKLNDIIFPCLN